jgi:hypothetical protein
MQFYKEIQSMINKIQVEFLCESTSDFMPKDYILMENDEFVVNQNIFHNENARIQLIK